MSHLLRRRWPIPLFIIWSGFIWVTRILNAWAPTSEESTTAKLVSTVTAGALLIGAVAAAAILVRARARDFAPTETLVLRVVAGATVAVWAVRIPLIVADPGHVVGFKVVHVALGVLSVVLAVLTWRRAGPAPIGSSRSGLSGSSGSVGSAGSAGSSGSAGSIDGAAARAVSPAANVGR